MEHGKVDTNQAQIVDALRKVGASVAITSDLGAGYPDLTVGFRGQNYLIEVKILNGKLTRAQVLWHHLWQGQVSIVRNEMEALKVIGAI